MTGCLFILLSLVLQGAAFPDKTPLKIMIACQDKTGPCATELKAFLDQQGIQAVLADWNEAGKEAADHFDLVIVCGDTRYIKRENAVLDYGKPVLGYGPYGCNYFGLLDLKNGHPYT
jgi:hypothetical protein